MIIRIRLVARLVGAVVLWAAVPAGGYAESADNSAPPASATRVAPPAAATRHAPLPPTAAARVSNGRAWSIEDALPDRSKALSASTTASPARASELGRIPWQSGTFGFETKSQVNPYELPEGRRIPGLEATAHKEPSYLGLSLSLPSNDKLFPVPSPPLGSNSTRPE
jgi:hypothetical protein